MQRFACNEFPKHAHQVSQLAIHGDSALACNIIPLLQQPLPNLSKLCIESTVLSESTGLLPLRALAISSLLVLHMVNVIPAEWKSFTGLTTLVLSVAVASLPLEVEDLLSVLRSNPHIESIRISISDQGRFHGYAYRYRDRIRLAYLRHLSLGRDLLFSLSILDSVQLPPTIAVVDLQLRVDTGRMPLPSAPEPELSLTSYYFVPLLHSLHSLFKPRGLPQVPLAAAATNGQLSLSDSASARGRSTAAFRSPSLTIALDLDTPQETGTYPTLSTSWLVVILQLWSFPRLTDLSIEATLKRKSTPSTGLERQFDLLLDRFPAVTHLQIRVDPEHTRAVLYPLQYPKVCAKRRRVCCPKLRWLWVPSTADSGQRTAIMLRHFEKKRADAGCPVNRVDPTTYPMSSHS